WFVPELHALETWSDARAEDGTATILQPLIAPLYQGWSAHEVLAVLGQNPDASSHSIVKGVWQGRLGVDFESTWRRVLHDGVVPDTAHASRAVALRPDWQAGLTPPVSTSAI